MIWGILGALDEEVALIREKMQVKKETPLFGTVFYEGSVEGKDIVLVCCGIGKVNAAMCAVTVLREFGADLIVNVGIAGAVQSGLHILDVVISREVAFHDQDPVMLKFYPQKQFFEADSHLIALCQRAASVLPEIKDAVKLGRIVSGDVFVNSGEVRDSIKARLAPACVEMEGAAIGHVAYANGKPFLIIRTMSDSADDAADKTYDDFMHRAAVRSASIILKMLELGQ